MSRLPFRDFDNVPWSPLHAAGPAGELEVVEYLIQKGAKTKLRDPLGRTPLAEVRESRNTGLEGRCFWISAVEMLAGFWVEVDGRARTTAPELCVMLMFCRVITAQVDYIVALGDKDSYMMQVDEILYRRESR